MLQIKSIDQFLDNFVLILSEIMWKFKFYFRKI